MTAKLLEDTGHSLTRKTLRRSRILLRADKWSETTTHQRWQTDKTQHGELRTNRVVPGISTGSSSSTAPTSPTSVSQEAGILILHPASTRSESPSCRVRGHPSHEPAETKNTNRNGRGHRSACFSGIRSGTSYESANEIKEAQNLYSLPKRPKLRSLHEDRDSKGSLRQNAPAQPYLEQIFWVTR